MSIEIGPTVCDNCIFKDAGIALSANYKMQEIEDMYEYNYYNSLLNSPNKLTSTKFIEKINLVNIRKSMVIQHYRFGRFGNFLFVLADLAIVTSQFKQYFKDEDVEMITTWHETYFTDIQSRQKNIYRYKCTDEPSEIYKYIKCRHFAHNDIFCLNCVKQELIGKLNVLCMMDKNGKCYGFVRLVTAHGIHALHILINEMTDNYFLFENVQFDENLFTKNEINIFKNMFYMNKDCKKIVSIGGYLFGCDTPMLNHFASMNVSNNYKIHLYFNFDYLLKNKEVLMKYLFSNRQQYIDKYVVKKDENIITVCGHLRAGDYSIGTTFIYYVLYYTYYLECLQQIQKKHPNKHIKFTFCFHPGDVKIGQFYKRKLLENLTNISIVFESELNLTFKDEIDHISYMGLSADYYIASNSSYSYWGVFLKGTDTIVYYPKYYGVRYQGTNIYNVKKTLEVIYRHSEFVYPTTGQYIPMTDDKVLHPVYYAILMNDVNIKDLRKSINIAFDPSEFDKNDTSADICLKNALATESLKPCDMIRDSCNPNLIEKYANYSYNVHLYHLDLHNMYVKTDKYNFDNVEEMYTDKEKSVITLNKQ